MRVKIRGKVWEFHRVHKLAHIPDAKLSDDGMCEGPHVKGRRIWVRKQKDAQAELDAIIHECLHAALWDLDDETVHDTAHDIAKIIYRLGWRRTC